MPVRFNIPYEFDRTRVLERIRTRAAEPGAEYVCVAEGNIMQQVHRDEEYRRIVCGSLFAICDSSWVPVFLKHISGEEVETYYGSQLMSDILSEKNLRSYFLGATEDILLPLRRKLAASFDPAITEFRFCELPFCEVDDFDYPSIAAAINEDNPDVIWVSLGAPKQEIFISRLKPYLNRGVLVGVGAAFKFFSGVKEKRAPKWMIKAHLEFVYRLFVDPKKQIRRCARIVGVLPSIIREERSKHINK